jgi:MinD superfamily P-loop ATPase
LKIAILSGKGGTGKTTLSVNLFSILNKGVLIDTDTEEPNSHIFLKGTTVSTSEVYKNHPVVDYDRCDFCGKCGDHCNFNAIIPTKNKVIVFEDLCHDCGFCEIVCPTGAISYKQKAIGTIHTNEITATKKYHYGKLSIGEVSGVRLIDSLKEMTEKEETLIIDCPPGVSCSTVAAISNVDYAIVCAEPTPFGISDMKMVVELLRDEDIKFGVVVNKSGIGNEDIYDYLKQEKISLLAKIPFTKERALLYSNAKLITEYDPTFKEIMKDIVKKTLGENHG